MRVRLGPWCILGAVCAAYGCGESAQPSSRGEVSGGTASGSGGSLGSAGAAGSGTAGTVGSSGSSSSSGGTITIPDAGVGGGPIIGGNEDTCDGVDNDANGIVDDVDVGKDGVCDCLRVGTIGEPGVWGDGNIFATWLDARTGTGVVNLADQVVSAESLGDLQVIVVQDASVIGRDYAPEEVAALDAWMQAGGGLMTLIGYDDPSERTNVNLLLGPTGLSYGEQPILQKQGGATTLPITEWLPHPTTEGVTSIGVDNGYPVVGAGTVVAREGQWDVGQASEYGSGKVFVWADEWITYDTEWSEHPEYQVELFWLNIIKFLTPANECQVPIPTIPK